MSQELDLINSYFKLSASALTPSLLSQKQSFRNQLGGSQFTSMVSMWQHCQPPPNSPHFHTFPLSLSSRYFFFDKLYTTLNSCRSETPCGVQDVVQIIKEFRNEFVQSRIILCHIKWHLKQFLDEIRFSTKTKSTQNSWT